MVNYGDAIQTRKHTTLVTVPITVTKYTARGSFGDLNELFPQCQASEDLISVDGAFWKG